MKTPFVIFALPRSRTTWASRFLTYGDWTCGHDAAQHFRTVDDAKLYLSQPCIGTVETAAAPWWRLARRLCPEGRFATIRRPADEVVDSAMRAAPWTDAALLRQHIARLDRKLDQIEHRIPDVLSLSFADLAQEENCAKLFTHCLPYEHDTAWWRALAPLPMSGDMRAVAKYCLAFKEPMARGAEAATLAELRAFAKRATKCYGVEFQEEKLAAFIEGGKELFAEHAADVGEPTDSYLSKNIPVMETLEANGVLSILTARSNGRMFGYLMSLTVPSLEYRDAPCAVHTLFYASPAIRGLGMKLQRESVARLAQRGVKEVFLRAGVRGAGAKISAVYRRMGAVYDGDWYRLGLQEE